MLNVCINPTNTNRFLTFALMNELKNTKDFLQNLSDSIHYFVRDALPDSAVLTAQIFLKFVLLIGMVLLIGFVLKLVLNAIFKIYFNNDRQPILKAVYLANLPTSIAALLSLLFASFALYSIFCRQPLDFLKSPRACLLRILR